MNRAIALIFALLVASPAFGSGGTFIDQDVQSELMVRFSPDQQSKTFTTTTSMRAPEACDWSVTNERFTCTADNESILQEFTRTAQGSTSVSTMTASDVATWINADSERNPQGFNAVDFTNGQMFSEWEVNAIHPITNDLYVINNVNSSSDCTSGPGGDNPQDVQHLYRLVQSGGIWTLDAIWRMPSANGSGGQCTGGLNVYPVFEFKVEGFVIDSEGRFWVSDDDELREIFVPPVTSGEDLVTLSGVVTINIDDLFSPSTSGSFRMNYDQTNNRVFLAMYDRPTTTREDDFCTLSDPPCRVIVGVFDWPTKKLIGMIDASGYDRFIGSDNSAAQIPNIERPRNFVFVENGQDAGDAFMVMNEDSTSQTWNNFFRFIENPEPAVLGSFQRQFRFPLPADGDRLVFKVRGTVDVVGLSCFLDGPISTGNSGSIAVNLTRQVVGGFDATGVFTRNSTTCSVGGGENAALAAATLNQMGPNHELILTLTEAAGSLTVAVLEVTVYFNRLQTPR